METVRAKMRTQGGGHRHPRSRPGGQGAAARRRADTDRSPWSARARTVV